MGMSRDDIDPDDIEPGADLTDTDLSGTDLRTENLSRAFLIDTDLSNANLTGTDLSKANLREADLSGAQLPSAILTDADLTDADLSDANLLDSILSGVTLNQGTTIDLDLAAMKRDAASADACESPAEEWEAVARLNNNLKNVYSSNGLINTAREYHMKQRKARRKAAFRKGGVRNYLAWAASHASRILTGYGVKLSTILFVMCVIYFGSTVVYWGSCMPLKRSLYYSIVTFTTSPKSQPCNGALIPYIVAMVETVTGTLFIVLLGYVFGKREQV